MYSFQIIFHRLLKRIHQTTLTNIRSIFSCGGAEDPSASLNQVACQHIPPIPTKNQTTFIWKFECLVTLVESLFQSYNLVLANSSSKIPHKIPNINQ